MIRNRGKKYIRRRKNYIRTCSKTILMTILSFLLITCMLVGIPTIVDEHLTFADEFEPTKWGQTANVGYYFDSSEMKNKEITALENGATPYSGVNSMVGTLVSWNGNNTAGADLQTAAVSSTDKTTGYTAVAKKLGKNIQTNADDANEVWFVDNNGGIIYNLTDTSTNENLNCR